MKKECILVLAAVAILPFCGKGQDVNDVLNQWNVITSGDLNGVNDYAGAAYVGGNVTTGNSFTVGKGAGIPSDEVTLAVSGDIVSGGPINIQGGSVVVGGSANGRLFNKNSGGTVSENDPADLPPSPVQTVTSASQYWSTLAANSSASVGSGKVNLTCGADPLAIFNVSASQMFGSGDDFNLILSSGTKDVIINISGTSVATGTSKFSQLQSMSDHLILNFYQADSVNFGSEAYGCVVAPNADVTSGNNFNSGLMCKDASFGEAHLPAWDGNVPSSSVPEPATWFSGAGALGMLAVGLFRNRTGRKK